MAAGAESKGHQGEWRERAEALERANELRTALLAAVSHDLRTPLASIKASVTSLRAGDVNFPLFLHVLGAGLLVGLLFAVAFAVVLGWRREGDTLGLTRFGLLTLLIGVFPAYVLMRVGAQWTEAAADYPEGFDPAWIGIGYMTSDAGALLIIVSMILSGIGLVKLRKGGGIGLARAVGIISLLLLAAYVVAVWAMTAKPD